MKKAFLLAAMFSLLLSACNSNSTHPNTVPTTTTSTPESTLPPPANVEPTTDNTIEPTTDINIQTNEEMPYVPNGSTPQEIVDVILNDTEFIYVCQEHEAKSLGFKTKELKLSEFNYWNGYTLDEIVKLGLYRVVDLDHDGSNEVIAEAFTDQLIVFHYEDSKVYGFDFNFRAMCWINTDGVCGGSSSADTGTEYTLSFDKETYTETIVAYMDGEDCYIGDKKVSVEEYCDYIPNELYQKKVPSFDDYALLK